MPAAPGEVLEPTPIFEWVQGRAASGAPSADSPLGTFSVHFASAEDRRWVRPLETTLPPEQAEELAAAIFGALRFPDHPQRPDREMILRTGLLGSFRVEVGGGPEGPSIRFAPSVTCGPAMSNRPLVNRALQEVTAGRRLEGTVMAQVLVGDDGRPAEVVIVGAEASPELRRAASEVVAVARFRPASLDGYPAGAWGRFPISFRVPRE